MDDGSFLLLEAFDREEVAALRRIVVSDLIRSGGRIIGKFLNAWTRVLGLNCIYSQNISSLFLNLLLAKCFKVLRNRALRAIALFLLNIPTFLLKVLEIRCLLSLRSLC